ncbi:MAG: hypothetical protein FJZ97_06655, partial [Chloroflexi bacterium]|nr:hypothetical protein [Chloroflexota bacterium]
MPGCARRGSAACVPARPPGLPERRVAMISLTLDGRTIQVQPGTNVLQAALSNG